MPYTAAHLNAFLAPVGFQIMILSTIWISSSILNFFCDYTVIKEVQTPTDSVDFVTICMYVTVSSFIWINNLVRWCLSPICCCGEKDAEQCLWLYPKWHFPWAWWDKKEYHFFMSHLFHQFIFTEENYYLSQARQEPHLIPIKSQVVCMLLSF